MAKVSVERMEKLEDGTYRVTVAVRNGNDFPIRLTMLSNQQNVILLDKKGFAYPLPEPVRQGAEVVVYANSSSRVAYTFTDVGAKPRYLRLYGTDFKI